MRPVLPLRDITEGHRAEVGGKAVHLGQMVRAGLPVPRGFAVPAAAYRQALADAGLLDLARRAQADGSLVPELRAALGTLALRPGHAAAVTRAAAHLGPRLAVRSSAADEDGADRSHAGQHLTVLGVAPTDVPAAVARVWASLVADGAIAYRGCAPAPGAMGVVVQELVQPEVSGVMFTVNPLTGSWREMSVEAAWGLGEGLVSGQVPPHWFLVRRPRSAPRPVQRVLARVRLHLVQQDLPPQSVRWTADGPVPLPSSHRDRPTLDRSALLALCRLGLRTEAELGGPQDIEWAVDARGRLVLLQARPITRTGTPRARGDVLWTRRFIGERWPDLPSVLGWSVLAPLLEWFIAYPQTQERHLGGGPAVRLVGGRPYMNATVFRHLAFKLPGAPAPRFMLEFFPPDEERAWQQRRAVVPDVATYMSIFRETFAERRWQRFRYNPLTNPTHWDRFLARMDDELPRLQGPVASEAEAVARVEAQILAIRDYLSVHVTSLLFANLTVQVLEGALAVLAPEESASLTARLTAGAGNRTLATNQALWELAQVAEPDDLEALAAGEPTSTGFARGLACFLGRYGHRAHASWELMASRWGDDPALLVPQLRRWASEAGESPASRAAVQREAARAAEAELQALLQGSAWRGPVRLLVRLTRRYLRLREDQRFWFDHLLLATRRTLLDLGASLAARGVLEDGADVALLTWEEIRSLSEGRLPAATARARVERRRAQRAEDATRQPAVFLKGDEPVRPRLEGRRMQGLGISGGRARGRVRVVHTPDVELAPGEVLVARAVDPGWTPLFLSAGAVVLEMGSRLSHGAVVAREYGVPAVVNLDGVTERLRDGDEVTVDGTRGVVWLHGAP